jgi:hypothetical protein
VTSSWTPIYIIHHKIWAVERCLSTGLCGETKSYGFKRRELSKVSTNSLKFWGQRNICTKKYKKIQQRQTWILVVVVVPTLNPPPPPQKKIRNIFITHVCSFPSFDSPWRRNCHGASMCLSFHTLERIKTIFNSLSLPLFLSFIFYCVCACVCGGGGWKQKEGGRD